MWPRRGGLCRPQAPSDPRQWPRFGHYHLRGDRDRSRRKDLGCDPGAREAQVFGNSLTPVIGDRSTRRAEFRTEQTIGIAPDQGRWRIRAQKAFQQPYGDNTPINRFGAAKSKSRVATRQRPLRAFNPAAIATM